MLLTPERKVPQRSDASQNDHKSKGYPAKTSAAAFTMQSRIQAPISDFCIRLIIRLFKIRLNSPKPDTPRPRRLNVAQPINLLLCFCHVFIASSSSPLHDRDNENDAPDC